MVKTLGIIAGGRVALRLWSPGSKVNSSTWCNSLITGNYPAANARKLVLMFPPYKNNTPKINYLCLSMEWYYVWPMSVICKLIYLNGLVRCCNIPSALALGMLQFCTRPSIQCIRFAVVPKWHRAIVYMTTLCIPMELVPDWHQAIVFVTTLCTPIDLAMCVALTYLKPCLASGQSLGAQQAPLHNPYPCLAYIYTHEKMHAEFVCSREKMN